MELAINTRESEGVALLIEESRVTRQKSAATAQGRGVLAQRRPPQARAPAILIVTDHRMPWMTCTRASKLPDESHSFATV